ncbi:LuxR C-terminal-related transcriptional regulator [Scleromatobacter humisilvae]|uniref:LuxR C-terminal-related transcriptional regulator n=1 Tax=Scleromatobacter humisilvae TaxID=2897159 RepID=A0A9X2C1J6_9BURK|nr:LuxR C-terminal-related transcriptional regulator [Scleromatobacter humisilvae]
MKMFAADAELLALEGVLTQPWGVDVLAATVSLAWHLRQRDSARALRLVDGIVPLLPPTPEGTRRRDAHRARVALAACEASALLCDFDVAERWLADARQHLDPHADDCAEGDAWLAEAVLAKMRVQRAREMAAHERAVGYFEMILAPDRLAIARIWLSFERAYSEPEIDHAIGLQPPGPEWPEARVAWDALWCSSRALALSYRHPAESALLHRQAAAHAREVGMVRLEIVAMINAGAATQGLGDMDLAAQCFEIAAARAAATGWPTLIGTANTRVGELMQTLGAYEESRSILSEAIVALSIGAPGAHLAIAYASLAETLRAMGRIEDSLEPMERAIALYREVGFRHSLALNLIFHARGLVAAGLAQRALAVCSEARALIEESDLHSLHVGVTDVLADLHHRFELPAPPGMTLPTPALHYAEAALAEGRRVEGWKAPARLYTFLAERWAEAGDHARAYGYARAALSAKETEATQKMNYPLALVRLRRRGSQIDIPAGSASGVTAAALDAGEERQRRQGSRTLTPKERSILLLLARNFSNKEIAKSIDVSDETVKWHLKNLFNKLDAGSRKHAVTRARSLGFISFSA